MITLNNVSLHIAAKVLLTNASFSLSNGHKAGIVGDNGCGKSTLFKAILGEMDLFAGTIDIPARSKVVHVEQELSGTHMGILDYILAQDKELHHWSEKLKTAQDEEFIEIYEHLERLQADTAPARAATILHGLGFTNDDLTKPVRDFSGGWRMRLALAGALFQPSDILLLDEPTNHLDLETTIWLTGHLKKYTGILLIISHDQDLLNTLCSHILFFHHQRIDLFAGNYETFQKNYALQQQNLARQREKQEHHRAHIQSFIDRFRYKASKARQAQSRIKMLEKMQDLPELDSHSSSHFSFPDPVHLSPPLITLDDVSTGYGDRVVLEKLSFSIAENDRIALLGKNGNGKSTLAKLLMGKIPPFGGKMTHAPKLEIGYFAQHQTDDLPLDITPLLYFSELEPSLSQTAVRSHLARFGLDKEKAVTKIELLSGGEKARLLFARMSLRRPALLILDEPTNHLDIKGRNALVDALNAYGGGVILITHDLQLIKMIADDLYLVDNKTCRSYAGDLAEYRNFVLSKDEGGKKQKEKKKGNTAPPSQEEKKKIKVDIAAAEKKLESLQKEKTVLEAELMRTADPVFLKETGKRLKALEKEILESENDWVAKSEELLDLERI
ncbi:MAG: ATP-binding cassette domain-containing protein [Lactobacillales bacterium]|jgi:ATP-binding cassette subfamily F protein 3|nr:ATP-binding cassette domain-containing protein [Lactobacillales bacterium]